MYKGIGGRQMMDTNQITGDFDAEVSSQKN